MSVSPSGIRATVGKIRGEGTNRFIVTYPQQELTDPPIKTDETITFSLANWKGTNEPQKGQVVVLFDVQLFAKGWRAMSAESIMLDKRKGNEHAT